MTEAATGAFGWLSSSFYVIVALAVVYLYFFRIVPLVAAKIDWSIFSIIRLTAVLILVAALLGVVAVNTADWIFANVLDTLPGTRMAREIDRMAGPVVNLSTRESNGIRISAPWLPGDSGITLGASSSTEGESLTGTESGTVAAGVPTPEVILKPNAMAIWAGKIQKDFRATGTLSDNTNVMSLRNIPEGIACEVYATADGWQSKRYEDWLLRCSNDNFVTNSDIQVNGTAARGLTGGSYYGPENRFQAFGSGTWPQEAIERTVVPDVPDPNAQGTTQSGTAPVGGPAVSSAVAPAASSGALTVENGVRLHTVQAGDNLAKIAETYNLKVYQIVNANGSRYPQLDTDPNTIQLGWRLVIP